MKKHARQMFIRANARRKNIPSASQEYSCGVLARSLRSNRAGAGTHNCCRTLQYSTGVKMFKNINYYNSRGVSTVQRAAQTIASRTLRYYCCGYRVQEIYRPYGMHAEKSPGTRPITKTVQFVQTSGCYANPLQSRRSCYGKASTT